MNRFTEVDGTRLKSLRKERALSQRDLARMSGVGPVTISELERGVREAQPSTIRNLAETLGVRPTELMKRERTNYVSVEVVAYAARIFDLMAEQGGVQCGWQPDPLSPPCGKQAEFLVPDSTRVSAGGDLEVDPQWRCRKHLELEFGAPVGE